MTTDEVQGHELMCDFVNARLDELERDAGLLGGTTGVINETWVRAYVREARVMVQLFRDNLSQTPVPSRAGATWALKWTVYGMAAGFEGHPDFDSARWGRS